MDIFGGEEDPELKEQIFNHIIRVYTVSSLLFMVLYFSSYAILVNYRKTVDEDYIIERRGSEQDREDALVYRISFWIASFSLAVSFGSVLLLPVSIISNEILHHYPDTWYIKWLNEDLIFGLWNYIFLSSNLSLFVLLPFAYFFVESAGFSGSRRGIMARVQETFVVLALVFVVAYGLVWVVAAILTGDAASRQSLFNIWTFYLPFMYSCVSLVGCVFLLVCTPVGIAAMFTVVGDLMVRPQLSQSLEEQLTSIRLEEAALRRRLTVMGAAPGLVTNGGGQLPRNGTPRPADVAAKLAAVYRERVDLEKRCSVGWLRRQAGYPLAVLVLFTLTSLAVLIVVVHCLELLVDEKALPSMSKHISIGDASLSKLGAFGAGVEVSVILYLQVASVVGLYSLPGLSRLRPRVQDTGLTKIILNTSLLLTLASASPVLSRTLGITNFDLLGDFGRIRWLGNFYLVLIYNVGFAVTSALCLAQKFTSSLRHELWVRFGGPKVESQVKKLNIVWANGFGGQLANHKKQD